MGFRDRCTEQLIDAKFIIAFGIVTLFAIAYIHNPSDDTMKGALIAGFAGAWGYYLGSSKSNDTIRGQVGQALDLAQRNQPDVAVEKADSVKVDGKEMK